jgi:Resolvase, N terminal domain
MAVLLIGYARCSTDQQDPTAQRDGLTALGVADNRVYVDHGLTGTNRERPGLREVLAACREGDTLVVTKLDRLARSLPDARAIADELTAGQVRLNLGGSVYDPTDPVGRLLFKRARDGRRVRVRPDSAAHQGWHEGCQGQRAFAWQAAKVEPSAGSASGGPP